MPSVLNATTTNGIAVTGDNSGALALQTNNGTTAVTIDTSQNVGIGVTPKTYSNGKALQINTAGLNQDAGGSFHITQNGYFNSSWKYIENGLAEKITYGSGIITFSNASNNTSGADAALTWSERMRIDSSGNLLFNSGYGSVATAYGCRAWVNFNGTGTPAIRASGNVTSITDNGTGDYTVNFTTAMPDVNYCYTLAAERTSNNNGDGPKCGVRNGGVLTTSIRVMIPRQTSSSGETYDTDWTGVAVAVFR